MIGTNPLDNFPQIKAWSYTHNRLCVGGLASLTNLAKELEAVDHSGECHCRRLKRSSQGNS